MSNKTWCMLFSLLSLLCFLAMVDMLVFVIFKNTAKANVLSVEKVSNRKSKINLYYFRQEGDSINVTKTKKNMIAEKFIQSSSKKIYYSSFFKHKIKFFNGKFDYAGFILISICFSLFLFTAFQYAKDPR